VERVLVESSSAGSGESVVQVAEADDNNSNDKSNDDNGACGKQEGNTANNKVAGGANRVKYNG
jgi:hypothetical protein